jgi:uncharacterized membrane protein YebE (DUF533 family)
MPSQDRSKHFVNSLHAIAKADGITTGEEIDEIEAIVKEFGLAKNEASRAD